LICLGFAAATTACGNDTDATKATSQPLSALSAPLVAEEVFALGRVTFAGEPNPLDPPYDRKPTEQSEQLRQFSLRAQALEAADPERFYVMRMDSATGDVLAVARSKAEAAAHAQTIAPGGVAPPSPAQARPTGDFIRKSASLSGYVDNRVDVSATLYDSNGYINTSGSLNNGGQCSGDLFAYTAC